MKVGRKSLAGILAAGALLMTLTVLTTWQDDGRQSVRRPETNQPFFARTPDGFAANPAPVAIQPRNAAGLGAVFTATLLLLLYAHRGRRYILDWVGAWLVLAISMFLASRGYPWILNGPASAVTLQLAAAAGAFFLFNSAYSFMQKRPRFPAWPVLPGLAAWSAVAPGFFGAALVLAPAGVASASMTAWAGVIFVRVFRERRMLGAALLGGALVLIAAINFAIGLIAGDVVRFPGMLMQLLVAVSVCFVAAALAMHLLVFEDINFELRLANRELESAQNELRLLATTDPLTGCLNRRGLEQNVSRELQRHRRYRTPLSVLFLDIDRFKSINDTYGHETGDQVLKYVGNFLTRKVREADYVVRWGGDEFVLLLICTLNEARAKAASLQQAFNEAVLAKEVPAGIGLSVGAAEVPADADDILPLIRQADRNMYAKKSASG